MESAFQSHPGGEKDVVSEWDNGTDFEGGSGCGTCVEIKETKKMAVND